MICRWLAQDLLPLLTFLSYIAEMEGEEEKGEASDPGKKKGGRVFARVSCKVC